MHNKKTSVNRNGQNFMSTCSHGFNNFIKHISRPTLVNLDGNLREHLVFH